MIYVMIVGGLSTFRMGKAAQGFSKAGYRIFGALCIFLGVTLIVALPCALYYTYSQ